MNDSNILKYLVLMKDKIRESEKSIHEINLTASHIGELLSKELNTANKTIENLKTTIGKLTHKLKSCEVKDDMTNCILCFENQRNVLFRPCNHLVICDTCSGKTDFTVCIICKRSIEDYEYAYL